MAGAPGRITINFDSNIIQVSQGSDIWSASGETISFTANEQSYEFNVTLNDGYIIDNVVLSNPNTASGSLQSIENTKFTLLVGDQGMEQTVTITSKPSTPRIFVDLATAFPDKWAALDPVEHTIQIRAKNPGNYLDSDLSTAITFVKVVNYTITTNLTNCTGASSNPTTIASNTTATVLTFTANTGYDLPASVTVTGATSSWNQSTGELTLTKPTGNVTIKIAATATALYVGENIVIPQTVRN